LTQKEFFLSKNYLIVYMADIDIYKINNLQLRISCSHDVAVKIANHFSAYIKNKFFHPLVKQKRWDGKIFFFNKKDHNLSIGFLKELLVFCEENKLSYEFQFKLDDLFTNVSKEQLTLFYKSLLKDSEFYPRDYQESAVYLAIKNKRGVLECATGAGKSLIAYLIIRYLMLLDQKIVLIVPSTSLVEQLFSDFREYGWKDVENYVNLLYSGKKIDESKPILISTWQSLVNKPDEYYQKFGTLLIDECLHPNSLVQVKINHYERRNKKKKLLYSTYETKKIKDVKVGDLVRCFDFENNIVKYKPVKKIFKNLSASKDNMYEIETEDEKKIKVTGNHKVYLKNGAKEHVKNLKKGDELFHL